MRSCMSVCVRHGGDHMEGGISKNTDSNVNLTIASYHLSHRSKQTNKTKPVHNTENTPMVSPEQVAEAKVEEQVCVCVHVVYRLNGCLPPHGNNNF